MNNQTAYSWTLLYTAWTDNVQPKVLEEIDNAPYKD